MARRRLLPDFGSAGSANPFVTAVPADFMGTYAADEMDEDDSSSSATSSDDGEEPLETVDLGRISTADLSRMNDTEAAEKLFYQYRAAKRYWRRFTGKPVRRFRRDLKHSFKKRLTGKGKGKSHGRGRGMRRGFLFTNDGVQVFLKGRGKGHRAYTTGKGHGRHQNLSLIHI